MPKDRLISGFFFASGATEQAYWMADNIGDAKTVLNPFGGVGRYASAVSNEYRVINNWDPQVMCKCIIEGVYRKKKLETNVEAPVGLKGYQYETRYFKNIDDRSAGFMDWVGTHGTLADKFAMITAAASMTFWGRLGTWNAPFEDFWTKFKSNRERLKLYLDMPGTITIKEGDVFEEDLESMRWDLMLLDAPVAPDIYSHNKVYGHMNRNIGGIKEMSRWTLPLFYGRIRRLLALDVGTILAKYQTGILPTLDEYRDILEEYGTITKEQMFKGRKHNSVVFKVVK